MRLIDADRLCEDLLNRWSMADSRKEGLIRQVMADIVTPIVVSQPTVNQWFPVSERLPEEAGAYLCTCKDAGRLIITLIKWQPRMKSWNLTGARTYWNVIAWLPLPGPWKEEEE